MLIIDSDHLDVLVFEYEKADALEARLMNATEEHDVVTIVINVQEKFAGWIKEINRSDLSAYSKLFYYDKMRKCVYFFREWTILPFDQVAAIRYEELRNSGIRGMDNDLKIAAIALCNDAIILTRNSKDFSRVPNLKFEDWLLDEPEEKPHWE